MSTFQLPKEVEDSIGYSCENLIRREIPSARKIIENLIKSLAAVVGEVDKNDAKSLEEIFHDGSTVIPSVNDGCNLRGSENEVRVRYRRLKSVSFTGISCQWQKAWASNTLDYNERYIVYYDIMRLQCQMSWYVLRQMPSPGRIFEKVITMK